MMMTLPLPPEITRVNQPSKSPRVVEVSVGGVVVEESEVEVSALVLGFIVGLVHGIALVAFGVGKWGDRYAESNPNS